MWQLGAGDIDDLARGAALLGAGGGGETRTAAALARRALRSSGPITVIEPSELAPDARAVPLGLVGSITVFEEKPLEGTEMARVVHALDRYTAGRVDAVLGFEAAGLNALLPVVAAAVLGLPLLDADGMGRAFPGLDQTVFTLHGLAIAPMAVADPRGSLVLIDGVDHFLGEQLARSAVVTMGGWALLAFAPQRAADLARSAIVGSVRKALEAGRLLGADDVPGLLRRYGGRTLFRGKVIEVQRRDAETGVATVPGRARRRWGGGSAVLEHLDAEGRVLRLEFQNENLLAIEDGVVHASVPDLICLLGAETRANVTTEQIRYGLELEIVTLPCAPAWCTPAGLRLAGPAAFGYDVPYSRAGPR
ncbi:DUF917 domain-containing protein [Pseudonocardia sp. H11422]|uniref:DUF917 domain-containing protein n=1 Tax=Pseudonocardia sp. H11422 TaxID=2835866 RepID=UPI001BDC5C90|nr:DUF917 domain-containing protein [Pseudonocardia sp. H11422]